MAFSHPYGKANVQASVNDWFRTNLTGAGLPAWMGSARVAFNWPDADLISGAGHVFSVTHLGSDVAQIYQGRTVADGQNGQTMRGLLEVDCWLSERKASASAHLMLGQMGDMVTYLFTSGRQVPIKNLYASIASPPTLSATVRVGQAEEQSVQPDPNPDIMRKRYLVGYQWVERVTGT
jgi:hypothetical protein